MPRTVCEPAPEPVRAASSGPAALAAAARAVATSDEQSSRTAPHCYGRTDPRMRRAGFLSCLLAWKLIYARLSSYSASPPQGHRCARPWSQKGGRGPLPGGSRWRPAPPRPRSAPRVASRPACVALSASWRSRRAPCGPRRHPGASERILLQPPARRPRQRSVRRPPQSRSVPDARHSQRRGRHGRLHRRPLPRARARRPRHPPPGRPESRTRAATGRWSAAHSRPASRHCVRAGRPGRADRTAAGAADWQPRVRP